MVLATLALVALLLHAGLLGGLEWPGQGEAAPGPAQGALTVRMLAPAPPPPVVRAPSVSAEAAAPPTPKERAVLRPRPATGPAPRVELPLPAVEPAPPEPGPAEVPATADAPSAQAPPPAADEPVPPAAVLQAPSPPAASDRELPVYRTRIPPPISLRYLLRRGVLQGTGELQWLPQGERYDASLEGRLAGIVVLTQVSQGGFDEAGVAPLRFTDRRATGALQAANFQREAGKISFSGPGVQYPLLMGSQDRLSWMIQLAAVVAAEPQRLQEGGKVVIHVVGARGDSRVWVFRFAGLESISAGVGTIQAARFAREATDPYDTRVDVWLDPLRHHLPARVVLRSGPDDEGLELTVQEPVAVP